MKPFDYLLDKIHRGKNPYTGFPAKDWAGVWFDDPGAKRDIFRQCLNLLKPRILIEVGSFVGESAICMAQHLKTTGSDAAILCVDTWCAGLDHYIGVPEKINMHFGRPDLFYRFIANVMLYNCQDVILPMALDSLNASRLLCRLGVETHFIYVDASHERGDVSRDYEAYWKLLAPGGGMLVDDLTGWFPGVVHDYEAFIEAHELTAALREGEKALLIKPPLVEELV